MYNTPTQIVTDICIIGNVYREIVIIVMLFV